MPSLVCTIKGVAALSYINAGRIAFEQA